MPSDFEQQFAGQLDCLYAAMARPGSYQGPSSNGEMACQVILHRNESHETKNNEQQTGEARVRLSDVPRPLKGGRLTVEGTEVWTVMLVPVVKNGQAYCTVQRAGVDRLAPMRSKD